MTRRLNSAEEAAIGSLFSDEEMSEADLPQKKPRRKRKAAPSAGSTTAARSKRSAADEKPPQLELAIKEEALELFRKGRSAQEVARELMLPVRAVLDWEKQYLEGNLMTFGKAREAAQEKARIEPALFSMEPSGPAASRQS